LPLDHRPPQFLRNRADRAKPSRFLLGASSCLLWREDDGSGKQAAATFIVMRLRTFLALGLASVAAGQDHGPFHPESVFVSFSPGGGCAEACITALNAAKHTVYAQAYALTSSAIAKALVDARKRGLVVEMILDKSQRTERYSEAGFVANGGVALYIDARHPAAHNTVIIIDGEIVITGSYSFTRAAEETNAENLLVLRDPALAARYYRNWQEHQAHSELFGPGAGPAVAPVARPAGSVRVVRPAPLRSPISLGISGRWHDYPDYIANLKATVEGHWREEMAASELSQPPGSRLTVRFLLSADGNIARIMSLEGAVSEEAKTLCQKALTDGNSYGRWTEPMIRDLGSSQQMSVKFTF